MPKLRPHKDIRIAILGCGPAGLLAAYAAELAARELDTLEVEIYSQRKQSVISGAQFLHEEIPGFEHIPKTNIFIEHQGDPDVYRKKLYGQDGLVDTSWDKYDGPIEGWSMYHLYSRLWAIYRSKITPVTVSPAVVRALEVGKFDLLINTVPRHVLCERPDVHQFDSKKFWIESLPQDDMGDNTIVYNGEQAVPWARASKVFGTAWREYGDHSVRPPDAQVAWKVLGHNCDCHKRWMHQGRFGKWQRGVLVSDVYKEVQHAVQSLR